MSKPSASPVIRLRGVRQNNLKNVDLDLPLNQLIVLTGLSGSGKSSLAFDTLFAEGQRRYIETFSPYARQFFDRMDKPKADRIEGIPPAIAVEQKNAVKTTRSTVGTLTEICDYMKLLWPHLSQLHCKNCGERVCKESPSCVWEAISAKFGSGTDAVILFDVPLSEKISIEDSLGLIAKQGYQRLLVGNSIVRIVEASTLINGASAPRILTVVQDRVAVSPKNRPRFVEACEQAYHFGRGKLRIYAGSGALLESYDQTRFSQHLHCAHCDIAYAEPSPALFSYNHPLGACSKCRGFGRIISIDYGLAIPDRTRTLAQGVVKPWLTGQGAECQQDLMRVCRELGIPVDVPFSKLPERWQKFVLDGAPGYGTDEEHEWPRAWYGVKGYFRWLESKTYKMHVRVLLSRYRAYTPCPDCSGQRFKPDSLLYRVPAFSNRAGHTWPAMSLADFYRLPVSDALPYLEDVWGNENTFRPPALDVVYREANCRLEYLNKVGLGYLSLDRTARSLSGGETQRVNLTTCLGTRLVNTLFVLDEPSVGLHPRDTARMVDILRQLRAGGNTVVVVEHEPAVMKAAEQIIDMGPGHGQSGGQVVFQGPYQALLKSRNSLTGDYLSGRRKIGIPPRRHIGFAGRTPANGLVNRVDTPGVLNEAAYPYTSSIRNEFLNLNGACRHNLSDFSVRVPLRRFVCITGVSGSGKSTLVRDVLLPMLTARIRSGANPVPEEDQDSADIESEGGAVETASITGWESIEQVVLVDQSPLGRTPRSTPGVYVGAFDYIREVFADTEAARQRGLKASAFSFNSGQGQCERCRGAGYEKIEMQFLSDVFVRCPECRGRRYREQVLGVRLGPGGATGKGALSIADMLEATVDEAVSFLEQFSDSSSARKAAARLEILRDVGLGYLGVGQPINTLSGGESQRLKLAGHLACAQLPGGSGTDNSRPQTNQRHTLFLFDEPTTGLHFADVEVLLKVLHRLVDKGHSVVVIEHNLELIKTADWVIDLGPEAGAQGGRLVVEGPPEAVADCSQSHTGQVLREVLAAEPSIAPPGRNRSIARSRR